MRLFLIHQYYKTPEQGGGIRSYYISQYLADKGHHVEIITAFNEKQYRTEVHGNVKVHYLPIYYSNHLSFLSRIHAFIRYVMQAIKLLGKLDKPDINYVISTPLTTGLIALFAKWKWKVPYVFEVGDLWPDAPVELGVIKNSISKKIAYSLEKRVYNGAKHIVALSPDIKDNIARKSSNSIDVVTNFADTVFFKPTVKENNKFSIGYFGTIGLANHLEYLIAVAEDCRSYDNIEFVIMGSGAQKDRIKRIIKDKELKKIVFKTAGGLSDVKKAMAGIDAVYVSFKNVPILSSGSPNKFFDGLAAGKLIIINFKGWLKVTIEEAHCGFYHDPTVTGDFINKLIPYLNDSTLLENAQSNSRKLALSRYDKSVQLPHLLEVISN